ncbi:helix-turn-helix domain-containing protein [Streptomyces jumonjinensis]|uniref:helix-turn-helix domain-containing protein n=1 Tax=Streptomyces jumonjinensis TaxID=1945 RepID=UPI00188669DE|nr:helix-turn-helix transcriptional regulator [Streptomyces jumonjinensis]
MTRPALHYKIVNPQLLEMLMRRTGRGDAVSVRQLADRAGIPHGTVGNLLTGEQQTVRTETAHAITSALGVDLLVLFMPAERAAAALPRSNRTPVSI